MPRFKSNYTGIRGWRYVVQTSMDILEVERYFLNTCISVQLSFPYYFLQYRYALSSRFHKRRPVMQVFLVNAILPCVWFQAACDRWYFDNWK